MPAARLLAAAIALALAAAVAVAQDAPPDGTGEPTATRDTPADPAGTDGAAALPFDAAPPSLAATTRAEREALDRLLASAHWPKRAIATLRLDRYRCAESGELLAERARDHTWQVRALALIALARRGTTADSAALADEREPRVVRTALRCGFAVDAERLSTLVHRFARSGSVEDRLLAAEMAAASGDAALIELARELTRQVILRMDRAEGGALSPRLARLTGHADLRRTHRWQRWALHEGRTFEPRASRFSLDGAPGAIAALEPDRFAALADYLETLGGRCVDLAIVIDCTASMSGELTAAQAGVDDLMLFVGDVVDELRIGIVAYRDRRSKEFETKAWDFTPSIEVARERLWQLSADGGGDRRELVHPALRRALMELSWNPEHERAVFLIGDAPPHVGYGGKCAELARAAAANGVTTHVIECSDKPVEHFADIAEAGKGRCVRLDDDSELVAEVAGLAVGDAFASELAEVFRIYLEVCR